MSFRNRNQIKIRINKNDLFFELNTKSIYFFFIDSPQHTNPCSVQAPSSAQSHGFVTFNSNPQSSHTKISPSFNSPQLTKFST